MAGDPMGLVAGYGAMGAQESLENLLAQRYQQQVLRQQQLEAAMQQARFGQSIGLQRNELAERIRQAQTEEALRGQRFSQIELPESQAGVAYTGALKGQAEATTAESRGREGRAGETFAQEETALEGLGDRAGRVRLGLPEMTPEETFAQQRSLASIGPNAQLTLEAMRQSRPGVTGLSAGQRTQVAQMVPVIGALDDVERTLTPELSAKIMGAFRGRGLTVARQSGLGVPAMRAAGFSDEEVTQTLEVLQKLQEVQNQLLYLRSGAAVTEQEFQRQVGQMPGLAMDPQEFQIRMRSLRQNLARFLGGIQSGQIGWDASVGPPPVEVSGDLTGTEGASELQSLAEQYGLSPDEVSALAAEHGITLR